MDAANLKETFRVMYMPDMDVLWRGKDRSTNLLKEGETIKGLG